MSRIAHPIVRRLWVLGAMLAAGSGAGAQTYPDKPVRLVVPYAAGAAADQLARAVGERLTQSLGQTVIVDNRGGAGGTLGADNVAKSPADGYSIVLGTDGSHATNIFLSKKFPYDPIKSFTPIAPAAVNHIVLVVHPSLPVKSMEEFVAYAKAHPGALNYGSTGIGTSSHLAGYMLAQRAGVQATHVAYKGAEALRDLLAGRIQFMFATIPSVMPHITAGKLRAIAVSSLKRSRSLPDVPTVADKGFAGFEAGSWFGFFAPKGTPPEVIAQLNKAVNEVLLIPAIEQQMVAQGADPVGGTPAQLGQFVQREHDKWRVIVRDSGARAE